MQINEIIMEESYNFDSLSYVLFRGDVRRTIMDEDMYVDKIALVFKVL